MSAVQTLYNAIIMPHLEYCNIVWACNYLTRLEPLFLLQKKAMRIINNADYLDHSAPLFKKTKNLNIFDINRLQLGTFMYKFIKSELPASMKFDFTLKTDVHGHSTRHCSDLQIKYYRTNMRSFSISVAGPKLWNSVNINLKSKITTNSFKNNYKRSLLANYW